MKVIKTVKNDKITYDYKLSTSDYGLIFALLGTIKYVVKCICNRKR